MPAARRAACLLSCAEFYAFVVRLEFFVYGDGEYFEYREAPPDRPSGMGEGARFSDHFSIPVCDIRSDVISAPLSLTSSRGHSHPAAAQNPREGAPARSASVIVSSAAILQTAVIRYAPFGDVPRLGAAA